MLSFLKNHPFPVEAFFEQSLVLTFATPKEELQKYIPECMLLDTFGDKWAFVAVAMVQTKDLRPKGFPKIFGNDFFLIGYRIFVRFTNSAGKTRRGLYILKSETDKRKMEFWGNLFTNYKYTTTDISCTQAGAKTIIKSTLSKLEVETEKGESEIPLPAGSPFSNWKEARKFAGPLPFTFSCDPGSKNVVIIEGVRENWQPAPVNVIHYTISFLDTLNIHDIRLASAFVVQNVPYYWEKGKSEKWKA